MFYFMCCFIFFPLLPFNVANPEVLSHNTNNQSPYLHKTANRNTGITNKKWVSPFGASGLSFQILKLRYH